MIDFVLLIVIAICVIALGLAAVLARNLLSQDEGTPKMREVSDAIRVGAEAFIKRQYSTIAMLAIVSAVVIFAIYYLTGQQAIALATAAAFIVGAACSAVAGVVAMWIAVRTNIRTAAAAQTSDGKALDFSFRGGAISGLIITSVLQPARTLTGTIAQEMGEVVRGGMHYSVLFAMGLTLFAITFVINLAADAVLENQRKRWRR